MRLANDPTRTPETNPIVNLRKLAHQHDGCLVRAPGCTDGPTALLHIRRGNPGVGRKPPDTLGVRGCNACHQYIGDGNSAETAELVLGALCRQLTEYHEKGLRLT